jgi:1,2-diacylglycerol 3-alpha-glucosyltransferase
MIIGEFNDSFPPLMDGVGNVVNNYMKNLEKLGDKVYVVAGGYEGAEEYDRKSGRSNVLRMPGRPLERIKPYGVLTTPPELYDRLMSIDFDIIHIHSPFYAGTLGRKIAKAKHIPLVGTFHTLYKEDIDLFDHHLQPVTDLVNWYVMRNYRSCEALWTPSAATRRILLSDYARALSVSVMENGCDMEEPDKETLLEMRKNAYAFAGVAEGTPILLMIAQHKDSKNFPLLLEAAKELSKRGVPFHLLCVGDGPKKGAYEAYVKEQGIEGDVSFLGMVKDRKMVASLYAIATLFTFPSLYDTSCLVMREAACFGVPVAFLKGACTSEGITDGGNGYLSEPDALSYSRTIERAITKAEERGRIGKDAHDSLYHSWADVVKKVQGEYRNLCASR